MSSRAPSVIRTQGLTKDFGGVRAVDGLDLIVRRGEIFGYLGPNGSGKTTTIRLLLDFVRPTAGEIRVLGGTGADPRIRARIGYAPGELRFEPGHTTWDVVEFTSALRGGTDDRFVRGLIGRLDLDPGRPIRELSTGNRRKVALVQAFMHRPELLILDEPTSGLDPLVQHEFHGMVREAASDGATVFLSSHVLHEVETLAGRLGVLRRGRLITVARIDELRARARQRLDLYVEGPVDARPFERLPEVVGASAVNGVLRLVVEGSVERVLKRAAKLAVHRVVSHEVDLDEVFLDLYRDDEA